MRGFGGLQMLITDRLRPVEDAQAVREADEELTPQHPSPSTTTVMDTTVMDTLPRKGWLSRHQAPPPLPITG